MKNPKTDGNPNEQVNEFKKNNNIVTKVSTRFKTNIFFLEYSIISFLVSHIILGQLFSNE